MNLTTVLRSLLYAKLCIIVMVLNVIKIKEHCYTFRHRYEFVMNMAISYRLKHYRNNIGMITFRKIMEFRIDVRTRSLLTSYESITRFRYDVIMI